MSLSRLRKLRAAAEREYARRTNESAQRRRRAWSPSAFCGLHRPQLAAMLDRANWIHLMCARQSGKSWADLGILGDNALAQPRSLNLFLGLKATAVRISMWVVWQRLCEEWGWEVTHHETTMVTTFANGARVIFAGTDDLANVKKYLGNRLENGVVIIDESQDQPDAVLRYILVTLLPPMCTPTTRVIVSGVLPDVPAGYFYELSTAPGWSHHEWGRAANVHTPEAMEQLQVYLRLHNISIDDPQIQRDWFMARVWDLEATAFRYSRHLNGYQAQEPDWMEAAIAYIAADLRKNYPGREELLRLFQRTQQPTEQAARFGLMAAVPHAGIDLTSCAIDTAGGDRIAVEVTGWGRHARPVQHLFEWSSPRNAHLTMGQIAPVLGVVARYYGPTWWVMDGVTNEVDTFQRDYGVPAIKAPKKTDRPGQVRRTNDLLELARFQVMIGSALEQDFQRTKWDKSARARNQWEWDSAWHPDPADAGRYTLGEYWDVFEPKDERTPEQKELAAADADPDLVPPDEGRRDVLSQAVGWR